MMDSDLQILFATKFRSISESFKQHLIRRGFTTIASLKSIPTEPNALRSYFADCPEFGDLLQRRTFQMLLQEVNPERATAEYVNYSMTAKQLATLRSSLPQHTGRLPQPSSSGNQTASRASEMPSGSRKPAEQPLNRPLSTLAEENVPVHVAVPTPPVQQNAVPQRGTQAQPTPSYHQPSNDATEKDTASSATRDNHGSSNPPPPSQPRSPTITPNPPSDVERREPSGSPKSIIPAPKQAEGFPPERIALLGRQIAVGAEYDACMDVFFDSSVQMTFDIRKADDGSSMPVISVMPFPSSLNERLNILGLCSNQKANYLVGLRENKLITGLATESIAGSDEEKAIIHFRCKSHTFSRQITAANYQKHNAEATHVAVGVEYGTELIFIFTEKKNGENSLVKYLTEVVDRIKLMKQGGSIGMESRFTKINCKAYCNSDEYSAKNFYQAVIILHSLMGKIENKQPQTAIILPLHRTVASPSQETLDEIERFAVMTASTNRYIIELKRKYPDLSKIIGIESLEVALRSMYEQALNAIRQMLINARYGTTNEKSIVQFLRENFTQNKNHATVFKYTNEAISSILNSVQGSLEVAGIKDKGIDPKIVLEIAIAPTNQSLVQAYFSSGDAEYLFPWLRSLGREKKLDQVNSFVEFCKANRGKEQQFCYRFKKNTDSSRIFTCYYEDGGETFLVPHRVNGGFVNISPKLISTTSITLSVEICWTREGSDNHTVAATKTVPCEARVTVNRQRGVETIKTTVPNDITIEDLTESTSYAFKAELIFPGGFTLTEHQWSKQFRTLESRAKKMISRLSLMESEKGFHALPKTVVVEGTGYRKYEVGSRNIEQTGEKVILVVGGTGSGKSTFINAMANYLYEVGFWNPFRLQLITKEDEFIESGSNNKAQSQTKIISAYELNDTRMPYRVTIVDTPGFGDTEGVARDKLTMEYIKEWFKRRDATGLQTIDAVCIVIKSTESRLTARAEYELRLVQSLFSESVRNNIITAFSFSDGNNPVAMRALDSDGLLIGEHKFHFNNSCYIELFSNDSLFDAYWKRSTKSFEQFFKAVETFEPRSVVHTLAVLRHRRSLEKQAARFCRQITAQSKKISQIEHVIEQLNSGIIDLRRAQNFTIKQKRFKPVEIPVKNGIFTTFCKNCSITCHEDCKEVKGDDRQRFNCDMMTVKDPNYAHCTACPNKCPWNVHIHSNIILKQVECEEEITVAQIFEHYHIKMEDRNSAEYLLELLAKDLLKESNILGDTVKAIRQHLKRLNEIALRPGLTTDSKYLIHLIEVEKQTMEEGAAKRIGVLERHLKIVKLLEDEQQPGGYLNSETESASIAYLGHKFPELYKQLADKGYFATNSVRLDSEPVSPEKMLKYVERQYPVEFRSVSRNSNSNSPANASKVVVAESFSRTFPSLSATALKQLKEEENSTSLSGHDTSSEHSDHLELAELNTLIDQVKLTDDVESNSKSKPTNKKTGTWKRLKKKIFS